MGIELEITMASAPVALKASMSVFSKFIGSFSPTAEIVFSIKGYNYQRSRAPFKKEEQGLSGTLSIRGTAPFCLAMLGYLISIAQSADSAERIFKFDYVNANFESNLVKQTCSSQLADILRSTNTVEFIWTGDNYHRKETMWGIWVDEQGAKIEVKIRGKRGFVQLALRHLQEKPQLMNLILSSVDPSSNRVKVIKGNATVKTIE